MGIRNDIKVGANVEHLDMVAEQGHTAKTTVISRIAVFEGKNTLPAEHAIIVANEFQGTPGDGFIKKLQAFLGTGAACRGNADFTCFQAIQPEPETANQHAKKQ